MGRLTTIAASTLTLLLVTGPAALACGFLVAENGAIRLDRFTALAAWVDGQEHYVTSFTFQGKVDSFGAIVPLPAEPSVVEKAGSWTLQRLKREVTPVPAGAALQESAEDGGAEVVATYEVEALDIVILRGGGQDVIDWTNDNGFALGIKDDPVPLLDFYAERSPYFAAVRYDLDRAEDLDRQEGDGTPVHFVFDGLDGPWIPLRVLGFDKPAEEIVVADIFLLTPSRPSLLVGAGVTPTVSRRATPELLDELRDDENSEWVPQRAWLTYIDLAVPVEDLTFDLAASVDGTRPDPAMAFGAAAAADPEPVDPAPPAPEALPGSVDQSEVRGWVPAIVGGFLGLVLLALGARSATRSRID